MTLFPRTASVESTLSTLTELHPVYEAQLDAQIAACFDVMHQLRPMLRRDAFVARVTEQRADGGYRLVCLETAGAIVCVAGYRTLRNLAWGRFLYVDDFVTDHACRSMGYGKIMLNWLRDEARRTGCEQFHLDSGVQRIDAHRFYRREGMDLSAYHFAEALGPLGTGVQ